MRSIARILAVCLLTGMAAACGPPPEDDGKSEVVRVPSALNTTQCIGATPTTYMDVYFYSNLTGPCLRVAPFSQVPYFRSPYLSFTPYSIRLGPRTHVRFYTGESYSGTNSGNAYTASDTQSLDVADLQKFVTRKSFAMMPIGYRYDGGVQLPCDSATTVPGPRDMILYNGTNFGGICAVFRGVYPNYYYVPYLSDFGWDPAHYPVASVKLGSAASATAYQYVNFDSGGLPPFAMPTGWSFPQVTPFNSVIWH